MEAGKGDWPMKKYRPLPRGRVYYQVEDWMVSAMIDFRFNILKTIQATAILVRHSESGDSENYTRVIKLLYKAERESIQNRGKPITGDHICVMKQGPVLSRVFDLIKGVDFDLACWKEFVERSGRFSIRLLKDPGNSELSPYEIELLERVCAENEHKDLWEIIAELHELPEVKKRNPKDNASGKKSISLPLEGIIEGLDTDSDDKRLLIERAEEASSLQRLFHASS